MLYDFREWRLHHTRVSALILGKKDLEAETKEEQGGRDDTGGDGAYLRPVSHG